MALEQASDSKEHVDLEDLKGVAATMYAAGVDTVTSIRLLPAALTKKNVKTWAALAAFFIAMVLNPEVQRKAQEEIDRVVGTDRLPQFTDRENLPYLECVVQEVLR